MSIIQVGDHFVNLDNVVSLDVDGATVARIWYVNSPTPVRVEAPMSVNTIISGLKPSMVVVGDQIVNVDNIVSFDTDGNAVVRIWFVGSTTPIPVQPPIHAQALFNILKQRSLI